MIKPYFDKYADVIISSLLKLKKDDLLSINTEETDLDFARVIANKALTITENTVKLVVTENGKVQDVLEFEPQFPPGSGRFFAMLRLSHFKKEEKNEGQLLDVIVEKEDFITLKKLGHLADPPILGRRMASVWCVAPVYEDYPLKEKKIKDLIESDIQASSLAIEYRRKYLNHVDLHKLHIKGNKTDLTLFVPEDVNCTGGSVKLSNGRDFLTSTEYERIVIPCIFNKGEGSFTGTCKLFGKERELDFDISEGTVSVTNSNNAFDRFISYDSKAGQIGFIEVSDKTFVLNLGGCCVDVLDSSCETLPSWFNDSPYQLKIEMEKELNIFNENCEGKTIELTRKGFFLE